MVIISTLVVLATAAGAAAAFIEDLKTAPGCCDW